MGVERSVTRWYIQRQMLLMEAASLEGDNVVKSDALPDSLDEDAKKAQLDKVQKKIQRLGHCPKPMMG